jgi:hypothetical protein
MKEDAAWAHCAMDGEEALWALYSMYRGGYPWGPLSMYDEDATPSYFYMTLWPTILCMKRKLIWPSFLCQTLKDMRHIILFPALDTTVRK